MECIYEFHEVSIEPIVVSSIQPRCEWNYSWWPHKTQRLTVDVETILAAFYDIKRQFFPIKMWRLSKKIDRQQGSDHHYISSLTLIVSDTYTGQVKNNISSWGRPPDSTSPSGRCGIIIQRLRLFQMQKRWGSLSSVCMLSGNATFNFDLMSDFGSAMGALMNINIIFYMPRLFIVWLIRSLRNSRVPCFTKQCLCAH